MTPQLITHYTHPRIPACGGTVITVHLLCTVLCRQSAGADCCTSPTTPPLHGEGHALLLTHLSEEKEIPETCWLCSLDFAASPGAALAR